MMFIYWTNILRRASYLSAYIFVRGHWKANLILERFNIVLGRPIVPIPYILYSKLFVDYSTR